ncbi:MAG: glycoside hydrolase [Acidobacteria bacterium]|nr:MAG: glycoside hydrolase [Acidobacteriota bacterium]
MRDRYSRREFVWKTLLVPPGLSALARLSGSSLGEAAPPAGESLWKSFVKPPDDSRIMMRWWWFGAAVTNTELEREIRAMKQAGIGGFEIQPVYPLALDNPARGIRNLPYLSDSFLDALRFVSRKAQETGMRLDLTLCSGWPYGGSDVPVTQAAAMLRVVSAPVRYGDNSVAAPSLEAGESLIAAWAVRGEHLQFSEASVQKLDGIGGARVPVPEQQPFHAVKFFIASRTGMQVKRAAVGAEGFVIDHYDAAAVNAYLRSTGERLMQAFNGKRPYAIFSDSLEVFRADWTPNMLEEFRRRRGYDLQAHLLALLGDAGAETSAIRCDWGRTLTELANDHYLAPLREWANRNGTKLRCQAYGEPPVTLSSNRLVDLPEGENSDWRDLSPARWASSACHLYGKPVASAETWTWIHSPAFRATPLDLKAEADRNFLQGINQIVGHGWPYSPPEAAEPGWRFYAAGALNDHNPWWPVMPDLALYLQRMCFLLRQGKPANDVALYLSTSDAWAQFTANSNPSVNSVLAGLLGKDVFGRILDAGFNFDFIDDEAIELVGVPYSAVVLPGVERIPLAAYQKIRDYALHGGTVIATPPIPHFAPGLLEGRRDSAKVEALSRELFEGQNAPGFLAEQEAALGVALPRRLTPDVELNPRTPEIGFIHRQLDDGHLYFMANTGNRAHDVEAIFRVKKLSPQRWDPFTATKSAVRWSTARDGRIVVRLHFEPYESAILVFSNPSGATAPAPSKPDDLPAPINLSSGWKVSFTGAGKSIQMDRLHSWTELEGLRFFSGQGVYEKAVPVPESMLKPGGKVYLNFGRGVPIEPHHRLNGTQAWIESPVREAAVVYVNGVRAGSVWRPLYELEVTPWLHPGANTFRIVVGNLAINSMAGKSLPDDRLLNERYGKRFEPQDMDNLKPLPSGLLGPVSLVAR